MRYFFRKQKAERVFIEADGFGRAGESSEYTGGGKTLYIDDLIVFAAADDAEQLPEMFQLALFFIPYQYFVQEGMVSYQALISFTYQEIDFRLREKGMQLFKDAGGQYHIADKSSLYDKEFLQNGVVFGL
jgi:hypothetical protein